MKKIVFLHLRGNTFGGVYNVDHNLSLEFIKRGYEVHFIAIRDYSIEKAPFCDPNIIYHIVNENAKWGFTKGTEIISSLKRFMLIKTIKLYLKRIHELKELSRDFKKTKKLIKTIDPNYIISSHYQLLNAISEDYLDKTINVNHASFELSKENKNISKTYTKYKDKIFKFVWLTENAMKTAISYGYTNSTFIYNAVRFSSIDVADVVNNKKLITLTRMSDPLKRIDLLIKIADEILDKSSEWILEIYGNGVVNEESKTIINNNSKIKIMGITDDPKNVYLNASINLNTSSSEGFCLAIVEASECGLPTVTFNFGEATKEVVINNKTGLVIENDDINQYIKKLKWLMNNDNELIILSSGAKEYNNNFSLDKIITKWLELFKEVDNRNEMKQ